METRIQQKEYADVSVAKNMITFQGSEAGSLAKITNTGVSDTQGAEVGRKISEFLQQLPKNVVKFTHEYKLQVISFVFLIGMAIVLRFVLAVIDGIKQIPLASTFFELIGIGYTTWLISRIFLAENVRQS